MPVEEADFRQIGSGPVSLLGAFAARVRAWQQRHLETGAELITTFRDSR